MRPSITSQVTARQQVVCDHNSIVYSQCNNVSADCNSVMQETADCIEYSDDLVTELPYSAKKGESERFNVVAEISLQEISEKALTIAIILSVLFRGFSFKPGGLVSHTPYTYQQMFLHTFTSLDY